MGLYAHKIGGNVDGTEEIIVSWRQKLAENSVRFFGHNKYCSENRTLA
jgi:hypothetical protein